MHIMYLNKHLSLFITTFFILITSDRIQTVKYELLPLWGLKDANLTNMEHGFPANFIGGFISTVQFQVKKCKPMNALKWDNIDCQALYIPSYCHFVYRQVDSLKNITDNEHCNRYVESELSTNPWIKQAYTNITEIVKIEVNSISTDENKITHFFLKCGQDFEKYHNHSFLLLCNWNDYLKLFSNDSQLDIYGQLKTSSEYSALYWYYFCTITWREIQNKLAFKMRHRLCPNPCSYGARKCSGIPHVMKSVNNIIQASSVSMKNCIPTGLGVFKDEYKCICEPGYSWSSDTKSCEIEDSCLADKMMAEISETVKDEDRLCDPKGTLRCIYTPYRSSLNLHYACICHPKYMGYRCDRLRNPCTENILPGHMSGNEACRTYLGNKCNPVNGTNYYTCTCNGEYEHSLKYSFFNCYEHKSVCNSLYFRINTHNKYHRQIVNTISSKIASRVTADYS
ncbi:unnamed protein product [Heterobilharzia americana]|nr:unnamed protein product [Heterobilharzia americana]